MKPSPILLTLSCLVMSIFIFQITTGADSTTETPVPQDKVMMCYWGYWSIYTAYPGNMSIENFDANLCTHLIFAFAGIRAGDSVVIDLDPLNTGLYAAMIKKKEQNPNLKTLLAIGGYGTEMSKAFSELANDEGRTKYFVDSSVAYVTKYNFDGIDMDWEFPGNTDNGGSPVEGLDKKNFVNLLQKLREGLDGIKDKKCLLTAAVGTSDYIAKNAYNVSAMNEIIDYFHLMAYDLRMFIEGVDEGIGHQAPLYSSKFDNDTNDPLKAYNLNYIIKYYVDRGASLEKLVLGVGTYGHTYTLKNRASHNFHDIAAGPGPRGPFLDQPGSMSYAEICVEVPRSVSRWEFHYDEEQQVPYAFNDTVWVGYEDERSAVAKTQYAMDTGLAGMMIWSIEQDDCSNLCGGWYNCPIISAIKRRLDEEKLK